jgi:hypothetical protein
MDILSRPVKDVWPPDAAAAMFSRVMGGHYAESG